jgi:tRNA(Leu) C34 or U34 (ribose-2'-O)-methylase TrmL
MARGFAAVGLYHPKMDSNVGGVLRAAGCFGAALVAIEGTRYHKERTDTAKTYRHIPLLHVSSLRDALPYTCVPIAVEIAPNARPIETFVHPERAFYVFGPEDGSLGHEVLSWCRDVVVIPTTQCLNLAAAVNVVLYDRSAKRLRDALPEAAE